MTSAADAQNHTPTPAGRLFLLFNSFYVWNAIQAAAELDIPDALDDDALPYEAVAEATKTHAPSLLRLLRLLTAAGLTEERTPGTFALTDVGSHLRADAVPSLKPNVLAHSRVGHKEAWEGIQQNVRNGATAFDRIFDANVFDHYARDSEAGAAFNNVMTLFTMHSADAIAAAYDFSRFGTLVDVGGGEGVLLAALLERYPNARGILLDRPNVIDGAVDRFRELGLSERAEALGGDFFETAPVGGDCYLVSHVLHDWDDERATEILRTTRAAMPDDARLLVVEAVVPDRVEASPDNLSLVGADLNMMLVTGGAERTESEFRELFARAGFNITGIVPVRPSWSNLDETSIIEAEPGRARRSG